MRRLLKSKLFIVALVVVVILTLAVVSAGEGSGIRVIGNIISVPIAPLQSVISFIAERISGIFDYFRDVKITKAENEELLQRISELEKENRELERLERENKELRDALNFLDQMESFEPVGCTIIAKDPGNWFEVFTINRGSKDGIEINAPVITAYGLVGRVSQVDLFTSKVTSIIDMDSTVAARVSRSRDILIVRGDAALRNSGLCRMDYISPEVDIMPGDIIETSGLGGIYPKGIIIGQVKEVIRNEGQYDSYAIITPVVDFKRLEEVIVLKEKQ
ncbi:MAG TPA: rod shape-determining protein MreC [Thermoclostridium sp.]|nr:rod shape-determining protein MreC [Clostridiaceae bacterium]HOQ75886.1 rod shape-determining protein MreC [Thermoclostridium sp.]HPU45659.1 rod shape-determining protein MreC [Thermoclostridium sp.]